MSQLWLDGFDWIDPAASTNEASWALGQRYQGRSLTSSPPDGYATQGRARGTGIYFGHTTQYLRFPALYSGSNHVYMGFALKLLGTPSTCTPVRYYTINDTQFELQLTAAGGLRLLNGMPLYDAGLQAGRWYYIEFYVLARGGANGAYELRINGETVAEGVGVDMAYQSWDGYTSLAMLGWSNSGCIIDDVYICSDQGSENNGFLGDVKIPVLWPVGDHSVGWGVAGAIQHYDAISDGPVRPADAAVWTNADYLHSDTPTDRDLFTYESLPSEYSGATIQAVQVATVTRVTNPQALTLDVKCLSDASEVDVLTEKLMWDEYGLILGTLATDPATGLLWTSGGVNAAKFGIEVGS